MCALPTHFAGCVGSRAETSSLSLSLVVEANLRLCTNDHLPTRSPPRSSLVSVCDKNYRQKRKIVKFLL